MRNAILHSSFGKDEQVINKIKDIECSKKELSIGEIGGEVDPLRIELVFYMIYIDKEGILT